MLGRAGRRHLPGAGPARCGQAELIRPAPPRGVAAGPPLPPPPGRPRALPAATATLGRLPGC